MTDTKTTPDSRHVLWLRVSDFRGIEVLEMRLDGRHGLVRGANATGKTSAIEALIFALGGRVAEPVRQGADQAVVELGIDGYEVRRVASPGQSPKLRVRRTDDGSTLPKPSTFLDALCPGIALRPQELLGLDAAGQRKLLLTASGKREEYEALSKSEAEAFEERRENRRDHAAAEAAAAAIEVPEDAPEAVVSMFDAMAEVTRLQEQAHAWSEWDGHRRSLEGDVLRSKARVEEARTDLADAEGELRDRQARASEHTAEQPTNPSNDAIAEARDAAETIEERNLAARLRAQRAAADDRVTVLAAALLSATNDVEAARAEQRRLIREAIPIEGLELGDEGIRLDGVPLVAANYTHQIRLAVDLAVRLNPRLRVLLIDGAESFDRRHWEALLREADAHDVQVVATEVSRDGGELEFEIVEAAAETAAEEPAERGDAEEQQQ